MPYKPKTCAVCGKPFPPRNGNQLFCSDECRDIDLAKRPPRIRNRGKVAWRPLILGRLDDDKKRKAYLAMLPENMREIARIARECAEAGVSYGRYTTRKTG